MPAMTAARARATYNTQMQMSKCLKALGKKRAAAAAVARANTPTPKPIAISATSEVSGKVPPSAKKKTAPAGAKKVAPKKVTAKSVRAANDARAKAYARNLERCRKQCPTC